MAGFEVSTEQGIGEFFHQIPTMIESKIVVAFIEYPGTTVSEFKFVGEYQEAFAITDGGASASGFTGKGRYDLWHLTWSFEDKKWSGGHWSHSNSYNVLAITAVSTIAQEKDEK